MKHKIYIVGMGPGEESMMTMQAYETLMSCDTIIGYQVYLKLLGEAFAGKEQLSTPMKQERERCILCFEKAEEGKKVALICSGDAGVYGMASLMYEIGENYPDCELCVVPGVTAALSGAACLGAPLNHDFCVISLSDLLTPWETIENRLDAAAKTDFSICLYNPSSRKRADYLKRACEIFLRYKSSDTVCGIVKNIGRDGETKKVMTLAELRDYEADMFTTVFIGNSRTEKSVLGGQNWMVTPRGYQI